MEKLIAIKARGLPEEAPRFN